MDLFFFFIYGVITSMMMIRTADMAAATYTNGGGHAAAAYTCRSYCGNLSVDYPFGLRAGCGHPGYRDLLFCINDVLMLHVTSGSYRVLDIDYAYQSLTLDEPHMSTCGAIFLGRRGNGFVVEPWRAAYLQPAPDNVFMLLGCSARSPLFQEGFRAGKHLPCRNVSGMGCEDYYGCPAWNDVVGTLQHDHDGSPPVTHPPECCAVAFGTMKAINLSKLDCQGYSSAYSLAPLRLEQGGGGGAEGWSYGIRVKFSTQGGGGDIFCKSCRATGGSCGYEAAAGRGGSYTNACICGTSNSTTNCDSAAADIRSDSSRGTWSIMGTVAGSFLLTFLTHQVYLEYFL